MDPIFLFLCLWEPVASFFLVFSFSSFCRCSLLICIVVFVQVVTLVMCLCFTSQISSCIAAILQFLWLSNTFTSLLDVNIRLTMLAGLGPWKMNRKKLFCIFKNIMQRHLRFLIGKGISRSISCTN